MFAARYFQDEARLFVNKVADVQERVKVTEDAVFKQDTK
jgi:hypothetical protein